MEATEGDVQINAKTIIEAETRFAFEEIREISRVFAICGTAEGRAVSAAIFYVIRRSYRAREKDSCSLQCFLNEP